MQYLAKIKVAGQELTSTTSEGPYITNVEYSDCVSNKVLDIGATGSSSLEVTIVNPTAVSYDGESVELYVSPIEDGIESTTDQIIEEIGTDTGSDVVVDDTIETDAEEDDGSEGEAITDEELAEVEAEMKELQESAYAILEGEAEEVEIVTTGGEVEDEWTKIGVFTVYKQSENNGQIKLVCYDGFALMNGIYTPTITSGTIQEYFADYCTQLEELGVNIDSDTEMPSGSMNWGITASFRDSIGYFAGLCGGYADFDEDGVLNINQYTNSGLEIVKTDLISLTGTSGGDIEVSGFECNGLLSGEIASMHFSNPFMTQDILDDIYEDYKGLRLSGQRFSAMWNPSMQGGTFVRLMSEEEFRSYLKLKNYADENGLTDEIIAELNGYGDIIQIASQNVSFSGDATTQINSALTTTTATDNPSVEPVKTMAMTAKEAAESAEQSAAVALNKANEATESASVALTKANEATISAQTASEAASNAQSSADTAQAQAESATQSATNAGKAASQAQAAAEAAQGDIDEQKTYFWHDSEGAHVLSEEGKSRADIEADGLHVLSLEDSMELARFTREGVHIQDREGHQIAHFGGGMTIDANGDEVYRRWATIGERADDSVVGMNSVGEGFGITASGDYSHAEGDNTHAEGIASHAEGSATYSTGNYSHAEGSGTNARGYASHTEGTGTRADGENAHAEGYWTRAKGDNQHVEGRYNIEDTANEYAHIIGNGDSSANRSNAFTVDWSGNVVASGTITDGNGNVLGESYDDTELRNAIAAKQDTLTAGDNVTIDGTTISATDTTYTGGEGISISSDNVVSLSSVPGEVIEKFITSNTSIGTSWKSVISLALPKGTWLVFARLRSASGATSGNTVRWNLNWNSGSDSIWQTKYTGSGQYIADNMSWVLANTNDADRTVYVNCACTSTQTLGTMTTIRAVRLA